MVDSFETTPGTGIQAFDDNIRHRAPLGYGVLSGSAVSVDTGQLAAENQIRDTLLVDTGEVLVDGSVFSVSSQNVSIREGDDLPRWDVIWVDTSGSMRVAEGTPRATEPRGEARESTFRPSPPLISGTALALLWVPANAELIGGGDLFDRRVRAELPWVRAVYDDEVGTHPVLDSGTEITSNLAGLDFDQELNAYDVSNETGNTGDVRVDLDLDTGQRLIESPNYNVPYSTDFLDTESIVHPVVVPDGQKITVYRWGVLDTTETAPAGLTVELWDDDDVVVSSANTIRDANPNGITTWSNTSGTTGFAKLAVVNGTGSDYLDPDGVSATFGYEVK